MEYSKKALALALVLALSACGGGGGGDTNEPTNPDTTPEPDPDDGSDDDDSGDDGSDDDDSGDDGSGDDGSGDDGEEPPEEPPTNSAPVAYNDYSRTVNNENVNIDVLENDADDDGDTLSLEEITIQATHGSVAIDGDMAVYTPDVGYYGTDTFTYRISDGEESAEGVATVTVGQEVIVEGVVADSLDNEVKVSVDLGEEIVSTTSDSEGRYELAFIVEAPSELLSLVSEQQVGDVKLKLASALGSSDKLIETATSQTSRRVTDTELSKAKISYLTTAMWVYYEAQRGDSEASFEEFEEYVAAQSLEQLVDTASFIKVLANNPDYSVADGVDTLSFFTDSESSVDDTIFEYLSGRDAVNQSGDLSADYSTALGAARTELIENERLSRPMESSELAGNVWAQVRVRGNFSAETDKALTFDDDGERGAETGLWSDWKATRVENLPYSWTLSDGTVQIQYDDNDTAHTFACAGDPKLALFSEEAQNKAAGICAALPINTLQGKVTKQSLTLKKVSEIDGVSHFQSEAQFEYTLELSKYDSDSQDYTAQDAELDVRSYATTPDALSVEEETFTANRWSFTVPSTIEYDLPAPGNETIRFSGYFPDLLDFTESNTFTSGNTGEIGTWSMSDGALELKFESDTVSVVPFMETDLSMIALVTVESGAETFKFVSEMVPEDTESLASFSLVQELPDIWSSMSHCAVEGCWTFGKMKARTFAGFSFDNDGTMTWLNANLQNDAFEQASPESSVLWERDPGSNFIRVVSEGQDAEGNTYLEYRSWELLQESEEGWVKVIELYAVHLYYADDSKPSESFIYKPHIETLRLTDLSKEFPTMWNRTQGQ